MRVRGEGMGKRESRREGRDLCLFSACTYRSDKDQGPILFEEACSKITDAVLICGWRCRYVRGLVVPEMRAAAQRDRETQTSTHRHKWRTHTHRCVASMTVGVVCKAWFSGAKKVVVGWRFLFFVVI